MTQGRENNVRVLLVDDHDLFRTGLGALLEDEGFEVDDVSSEQAALDRIRRFPADLVVMDMNMPGMNGIEATRRMRLAAPETPVLMLTVASSDDGVYLAVHAGASGYLLKDAELGDIVAGIRTAAAGQSAIAPRVAGALLERVRATTRREDSAPAPSLPELSARERQVLSLLASGCDNAEIGQQLFVSSSTVKNHVSRVFEKLGVENRVQAAVYAIGSGLVEARA